MTRAAPRYTAFQFPDHEDPHEDPMVGLIAAYWRHREAPPADDRDEPAWSARLDELERRIAATRPTTVQGAVAALDLVGRDIAAEHGDIYWGGAIGQCATALCSMLLEARVKP